MLYPAASEALTAFSAKSGNQIPVVTGESWVRQHADEWRVSAEMADRNYHVRLSANRYMCAHTLCLCRRLSHDSVRLLNFSVSVEWFTSPHVYQLKQKSDQQRSTKRYISSSAMGVASRNVSSSIGTVDIKAQPGLTTVMDFEERASY